MNNEKNEKKITKLGNYKDLMEYISYINITVPIKCSKAVWMTIVGET